MPHFLLHHRHRPEECRTAFAAWKGYASPLRHRETIATCLWGGHEIWWTVQAGDERQALDQLPPYVAKRAAAIRVGPVQVP